MGMFDDIGFEPWDLDWDENIGYEPPRAFGGGGRVNRGIEGVSIEDAVAKYETEKGILVKAPSFGEQWLPKRQIFSKSEIQKSGDTGTLIIPRWLAEKKGIRSAV